MGVNPFEGFLSLWKRTEVFLYERLDACGGEVSDNGEDCSLGVIEQGPVVLLDGLEIGFLHDLGADGDDPGVVSVENLVQLLAELVVRLVHVVGENRLKGLDSLVVFALVEPRVHELEISELECRLKVLHH